MDTPIKPSTRSQAPPSASWTLNSLNTFSARLWSSLQQFSGRFSLINTSWFCAISPGRFFLNNSRRPDFLQTGSERCCIDVHPVCLCFYFHVPLFRSSNVFSSSVFHIGLILAICFLPSLIVLFILLRAEPYFLFPGFDPRLSVDRFE